jgi:hypothetical protein
MIIKGGPRHADVRFARYLLRRATNEASRLVTISHYPNSALQDQDLTTVFRLMAAQARAHGYHRTFYHVIMALPSGERLAPPHVACAVGLLADNLHFRAHQHVVVEHLKAGRQHFHVVFNVVNPHTGRRAHFAHPGRTHWRTSRQLEQRLGLKTEQPRGRGYRLWEYQRGKTSGIHPEHISREVTAIYHACQTAAAFITQLRQAGYRLARSVRRQCLLLVDRAGDGHGLLRRIKGVKRVVFEAKFPELTMAALPSFDAARTYQRRRLASSRLRHRQAATRHLPGPVARRPLTAWRPATVPLLPSQPLGAADTALLPSKNLPVPAGAAGDIGLLWRLVALSLMPPSQPQRPRIVPAGKGTRSKAKRPKRAGVVAERAPQGPVGLAELIAWARATGRIDILLQYGIIPNDLVP